MRKTLVYSLLISLCTLLLEGCASSAITDQAHSPSYPENWVRGGTEGDVSLNWLDSLNQPQLPALVAEAIANNYTLKQEKARLFQAEQAVVISKADRFPTVDVSLDGARRGSETTEGARLVNQDYNASLAGSWNIDLWGRLSKAQQAAQLTLAAQRARLESSQRTLAATTSRAVFTALEARQLMEVARSRLDNTINSRGIVERGYRQGLNDALDLYLAKNQVEREQAGYAQQQQAYIEAIADLQLDLARYPDGNMQLNGELPVIVDPLPAGLPSELLTRRADLQEAWLNLLAADAELAVAHKARFPNLSLVGSTGVTSGKFIDLIEAGSSVWSLSAGLTQPLFNAGKLKAQEEQVRAQVQQLEQQYLDLVFRAFADVENAISRASSLQSRYTAFLGAQVNSQAALELALEQYQRGLVSYTTVLESQRQAFDAEATVVQLRNQLLQNRISLYLALGGEFSTE